MCGRIVDVLSTQQLESVYHAVAAVRLGSERRPNYNLTPEQTVAGIRVIDGGKREVVPLRWGLIPSWSKEGAAGKALINARAETVAEKPSFRSAFAHRRCLVPVTGFYEWQVLDGGGKQPYFIQLADGEPMTFAGIWETWHDGKDDAMESVSIITTAANPEMAVIHNTKERMPVILRKEDEQAEWLDPRLAKGDAQDLLVPLGKGLLTFRPVGQIRGNSPDLLTERRVDEKPAPLKIKRPPRPDPNEAQDLQGDLL